MALLDLSAVTSALMKLLLDNITERIDDGVQLKLTAEPAEAINNEMNTLSLHMYHLVEETIYRNLESPALGEGDIANTPIGLCLYYVLTAHHKSGQTELDPLTEQKLLGYAIKTMHDFPLLSDTTEIAGEPILPDSIRGAGNPIQIIMRQLSPEEAISFWSAEDQSTTRLSAHYEVRVVLLEPDPVEALPSPALGLGTFVHQLGAVHLECSRSALSFSSPASAGGATQTIEVSPARVAAWIGQDPPVNQVELIGANLSGGIDRTVILGGPIPPTPVDLTLAQNQAAGWSLSFTAERVSLEIADTLTTLDAQGDPVALTLDPGIYTASVRLILEQRLVGGALVPISQDSNAVAVVVGPRLIAASVVNANQDRIELELAATFSLNTDGLALTLAVDGQVYVEVEQVNDLEPGTFLIDTDHTLLVRASFDVDEPGEHPTRLIVNGAESAPYWIELP